MLKNKKGVTLITVIMTILVLIIIAGVGFVAYTIGENKGKESVDKQAENEENKQNNVNTSAGEEIKDITKNSFKVYQENQEKLGEMLGNYSKIRVSTYDENRVPGISYVYIDNKGDAYVGIDRDSDLYSKYGQEYKVAANVSDINICDVGNGGFADIVLIHEDGTVSTISGWQTYDEKSIVVKKVANMSNIVKVVSAAISSDGEGGAMGYYLVDINGNIYEQ